MFGELHSPAKGDDIISHYTTGMYIIPNIIILKDNKRI